MEGGRRKGGGRGEGMERGTAGERVRGREGEREGGRESKDQTETFDLQLKLSDWYSIWNVVTHSLSDRCASEVHARDICKFLSETFLVDKT